MEKQIFIDKFIVPANGVKEFVEQMNYNRAFLRMLEGFIADHFYKQSNENGSTTFVTVAVWESREAIHKAKDEMQSEFKRIGFNPAELYQKYDIKMERGIYQEINN